MPYNYQLLWVVHCQISVIIPISEMKKMWQRTRVVSKYAKYINAQFKIQVKQWSLLMKHL